jgi:hypothetical protein
MPMTNISSRLANQETIEFAGLAPPGKRRTIDSFEYLFQPPLQRVNVVADPAQDWLALFDQWEWMTSPQVSLIIRSGSQILLTLNDVIALHFAVQLIDAHATVTRALLSFGSKQAAVARVQPLVTSALDRYLPPSVRLGIPSNV